MKLSEQRRDDLIMSATAYYLGRRTIAVSDHVKWLFEVWEELEPHVQQYIERIVEDAIQRERNMFNSFGIAYVNGPGPLGEKCYRDCWILLRSKWM